MLMRLEWLANRQKRPAALWLHLGWDAETSLAHLLAQDDFKELLNELPCLISEQAAQALSPDLFTALQAAGLRTLAADQPLLAPLAFPADVDGGAWVAGDWYLQAPAKPHSGQAASRANALQLVQLVAADADTRDIEAVLRHDAALSYHLLRVVNSLAMRGQREISSFAQAILILGRQQLRRWLNLMLFSARDDDERSAMLMARVAVRARSMELLAEAAGTDRSVQDMAFMAGMFSLLGALFGLPLAEVLRPLNLNEALAAAVLRHEGELGAMLRVVSQAEAPDTDVADALAALGVPALEFDGIRVQAARWVLDVTRDAAA